MGRRCWPQICLATLRYDCFAAKPPPIRQPRVDRPRFAGAPDSFAMSTASSSFDPELIDQTRQQLRKLVSEIEGLSRSEISHGEFYEGFLHRVVAALAAIGGAIWTRDDGGRLKLSYQMNFQQTQP